MKIRILIMLSLTTFLHCQGQDALAKFSESLYGKWEFFKTKISDRGGTGTNYPREKTIIVLENPNQIQFIKTDTSWIESYELKYSEAKAQKSFFFKSNSLTGEILFIDDDTFAISLFMGACGPSHFYKRIETAFNPLDSTTTGR